MGASEREGRYWLWDWDNQDTIGCRDYLLVADNMLYTDRAVGKPEFEKLREMLSSGGIQAVQEKLTAKGQKRFGGKGFACLIPFNKVQAVEHMPLLAANLVRIHHTTGEGKEQTLTFKVPPDNDCAQRIFEELRTQIAPDTVISDERASKWTAIRGPVFSLVFGGGWLLLAVVASTSDARAWQEHVFFLQAMIGWLIRFLGPTWLTIIAAGWIGASAWLLSSRLRNPPTIRVWRVN